MADNVDKKTRSRIMRSIKSTNTKPEMMLKEAIKDKGGIHIRSIKNRRLLPGSPDIVIFNNEKQDSQTAIFVDGCFWHNCPKHGARPKSNKDFWDNKLRNNFNRDNRNNRDLKKQDYYIIRVWECAIKNDLERTVERIKRIAHKKSKLGRPYLWRIPRMAPKLPEGICQS